MIYKFVLSGETPPKKNSRITLRNGRTIPSKRYTEWHSNAIAELLWQKRPELPLKDRYIIRFHFIHGDLRRRDSDNQVSSVLDVLQDSQIIIDDSWQIVEQIEIRNSYEKGNAKVKIEIENCIKTEND